MHILIAPNAFKNALTAEKAAAAIAEGLQQSRLSCSTKLFPVADGGDGTASLLQQYLNGITHTVQVHDPLMRVINAAYSIIENGNTAVIELANASGLRLLQKNEYNPLRATTFGTGELIKSALDKNVKKIILCIGGSATVDAGTGILRAVGANFYDIHENPLEHLPAFLHTLHAIDLSNINPRLLHTQIDILCDVDNPLLGEHGAAKVFGPQKGASTMDVQFLENAFIQLRTIMFDETGKDIAAIKHGGAAGGVAAGLHACLRANLLNGIDYFLNITNFNEALENAELVITAEGSIDAQTLQGKAPYGVALRAKEKNIPVIGLAGKIPLDTDASLQKYFDVLLPINNELATLDSAIQNTYANLARTAKNIGDLLAIQ